MAAPRFIQTVSMPTEYERQAAEARRRQALAEALEAQAYQPLSGSAAPTPSAAPLVMALQSFLSARQRRKAEEAGEQATQMEQEFGRRIAGRLEGGYVPPSKEEAARVFKEGQRTPEQIMAATPVETALQEVTPTAQYRKAPQEALSMAMTPLGMGAMKRAPLLATALEKSMEKPPAEEFGTTPVKGKGGKYYLASKTGRLVETDVEVPEEEMTPYQKEQIQIEKDRLAFQKSKAGQAGERPKAPSGFRYVDDSSTDLEPMPGGPQDPNRPMNMPPAVRTQIVTEQNNSRQFAIASQRTNKFIKDIQDGKLPLYKGAGAVYAAERAFGGDEAYDEENRPAYDRYYELERFVTEQVNMILSRAKGPQTDQDALRARQQILDNLDNKQVVTTALKTLDRLWNDEINLSESTIDDWYSQYNQPRLLSREDKEALNWANANPNDPRAAEIKSRLGGRR